MNQPFLHDGMSTAQRRAASSVRYLHVSTRMYGTDYTFIKGTGITFNVGARKLKMAKQELRNVRRKRMRLAKQQENSNAA